MTKPTPAWLLHPAAALPIATAEYQMCEYVLQPQRVDVPLTPAHCRTVCYWHEHIVPIVDLAVLAGLEDGAASHGVVILAYQTQAKKPLQYIGLSVCRDPVHIEVNDKQSCELPADCADLLRPLVLACFQHQDAATLVLNINHLCAPEYSAQTAKSQAKVRH